MQQVGQHPLGVAAVARPQGEVSGKSVHHRQRARFQPSLGERDNALDERLQFTLIVAHLLEGCQVVVE